MSKIPPESSTLKAQINTNSSPQGASSTPQGTQNSIQVSSTSILPHVAKDFSIGEIINFTVRGRAPDGSGLLYLLGQLVHAKIPEHLKTGDRVKAQIAYENDTLLFKILSVLGKESSQISINSALNSSLSNNPSLSSQSIKNHISNLIEEMLYTISEFLPNENGIIPNALSKNSSFLSFINTKNEINNNQAQFEKLLLVLSKLSSTIPSSNDLTDGKNLFTKLTKLFSSSTNETLKQISTELKELIKENAPSAEQKFLATLIEQLSKLDKSLESTQFSRESFKLSVDRIINALQQEIKKENSSLLRNAHDNSLSTTIKVVTTLLREAQMSSETSNQTIRKIIDYIQSNSKLNDVLPFNGDTEINNSVMKEVKTLINTIDRLTYTQEMLIRLEPVLQSMRQPELLLFPFLFQGFFSLGELIIDPDSRRSNDNKKKKEDNSGEDGSNEKNEIPKLQYQAILPLPHLGIVRFNTLQSETELELNLSFDNQEKSSFIENNVSDLRKELAKLGFSKLSINSKGEAISQDKDQEIDLSR